MTVSGLNLTFCTKSHKNRLYCTDKARRDPVGKMQMNTDQNNQTRQHIREEVDGGKQFVLHPADDELFTRTGRQVIAGCRLSISIEVWLAEMRTMFDHVRRWIDRKHLQDHVASVYAVPRSAGLSLFFVVSGESYDFDLADHLTDLARQLVRDFNIGPVEVHQLPSSEVERFIGPQEARPVYGHADESHQAMEA